MKEIEYKTPEFEFSLTSKNDNIIISRLFDVHYYNEKSKKSMELYDIVKDICDEISSDIKLKCVDYHVNYPYYASIVENTTNNENDYFVLTLKEKGVIFNQRIIPLDNYHPKARSLDIRPKSREIIKRLQKCLSNRNLSYFN